MNYFTFDNCIIFIIITITILITYQTFFINTEAFSISDIGGEIDKIKNDITGIPDEITGLAKEIGGQIKKVETGISGAISQIVAIEQKIAQLPGKIDTMFKTAIPDIFAKGIINPINEVIKNVGTIGTSAIGIVMQIVNKIVSLPKCLSTYFIQGWIDTIYFIYQKYMPDFIQTVLSYVYDNILSTPLKYILDYIGWTAKIHLCYDTTINDNVNTLKASGIKIGDEFKKNFGRLDFSSIVEIFKF